MLPETHKEFVRRHYEEYKKIGYVECPAFGGEKIYFNKKGFRHLIWKGTKLRDIDEQIKRLGFLQYATVIIKTSKNFKDYNKNNITNYSNIIDFWSFIQTHNNIDIVVLVRQIGDGPKHFFSIMERDKKHKTP